MTTRTFRATERDGTTVVHDPATGLTHAAPRPLAPGRHQLDAAEVTGWPVHSPSDHSSGLPLSVCWSPIVRCNLACPHCLDDKTVTAAGPVDSLRIASLIGAAGIPAVDISGGEPLLLRDLPRLAKTLTAAGCAVSVTTNGWHLKRRVPELAATIDAIRVSLDGPQAWVHDTWRGPGSFERAVSGIRAAVDAGIPVQIQTVLMASTYRYLQKTVELAAITGALGVTVLQMLPIGDGAALAPNETVCDEEARRIVDSLTVPDGLTVRLRTREAAAGFTVIRADGWIWRNTHRAEEISAVRPLTRPADVALSGRDGSA